MRKTINNTNNNSKNNRKVIQNQIEMCCSNHQKVTGGN